MVEGLPRSIARPMQFENGVALGVSNRWRNGQYCVIMTEAGLVGCGIYDMKTPAEFGQALAIARVRPKSPWLIPKICWMRRLWTLRPKPGPLASIQA